MRFILSFLVLSVLLLAACSAPAVTQTVTVTAVTTPTATPTLTVTLTTTLLVTVTTTPTVTTALPTTPPTIKTSPASPTTTPPITTPTTTTPPTSITEKTELGELKELERDIVIEAEGETLHYLEEKKWAEDEFSRVVEQKDQFGADQIQEFKDTYDISAGDFDVEIDKEWKLTILKCDVYVKLDGWYDFHWFLRPLGLDFIDDDFERLERELSWEGSLDGVKTTILLTFPFQINNCHAHVWSAS